MTKRSILLIFISLTLFCYCGSDPLQGNKKTSLNNLALQMCECSKPLIKINKELEFLVKTGRQNEAMKMLQNTKRVLSQTESCLSQIEKDAGAGKLIENSKLKTILSKECAEVIGIMEDM